MWVGACLNLRAINLLCRQWTNNGHTTASELLSDLFSSDFLVILSFLPSLRAQRTAIEKRPKLRTLLLLLLSNVEQPDAATKAGVPTILFLFFCCCYFYTCYARARASRGAYSACESVYDPVLKPRLICLCARASVAAISVIGMKSQRSKVVSYKRAVTYLPTFSSVVAYYHFLFLFLLLLTFY